MPGTTKALDEASATISLLVRERDELHARIRELVQSSNRPPGDPIFVPPGHFYSPIPSLAETKRDEALIWGPPPRDLPGIQLAESNQLLLFEQFLPFYSELPFKEQKTAGLRYYFENPAYSYCDAIVLYCMIRHLRPQTIIEVGSGYSSCATLDTNELFFANSITCKFVEPHPALLLSSIKGEDIQRITVLPQRLQDVDLGEFERLKKNDILFVDSTHVGKINSDVNRLLFEILPRLAPGVHIHFHDVFYPFEYPKPWIFEGRAWNEQYLLRAFLQYNSAFQVVFMNTFLTHFHREVFQRAMPLCLKNCGGSLWIKKT